MYQFHTKGATLLLGWKIISADHIEVHKINHKMRSTVGPSCLKNS